MCFELDTNEAMYYPAHLHMRPKCASPGWSVWAYALLELANHDKFRISGDGVS